jgi:4-hydroxythreonine-4-phosphate dehydrogenase
VNYTAGLSKIRTSQITVRLDIAGVADHNSFKEAVYLALDIYRSRINIRNQPKAIKSEINNTK